MCLGLPKDLDICIWLERQCCCSFMVIPLCLKILTLAFDYSSVSQILGRAPQGGRDAMLDGARMTTENRHTYTTFIDN